MVVTFDLWPCCEKVGRFCCVGVKFDFFPDLRLFIGKSFGLGEELPNELIGLLFPNWPPPMDVAEPLREVEVGIPAVL